MKRLIPMLLAVCMLLGLFAGCGGETAASASQEGAVSSVAQAPEEPAAAPQEEPASLEEPASTEEPVETVEAQDFEISMPLTEEPVTLSFFMRFNPQVQDWCQDMSDNLFYATMEELSGVHVDFQLFHPMNFGEQFNLQMASQDYADIYCEAASGYTGGFDKGVEDEVFLDLTPYIEELAPNYNAIIHTNEQSLRDATTDEGRIVFFAAAYDGGQPCGKGPMIRADWAEEFGMDPSEINTYEEYESYIEQAYNTYGATVQLPMSGDPGFGYLTAGFDTLASFGNSFEATLPWFQVDGKIQSGVLTDGFKEYVEMVADWYQKGWIYQDFMSEDFGMQGGADIGMVTSGESSLWWAEKDYMEQYNQSAQDPGFKIAAIQDAVKQEGDETHLGQTNHDILSTTSNCVISTGCEYPEIAIQWMDYRYTEEGATLAQFRYMLQNTVCLTDVAAKDQGMTQQQLEAPEIWMTNKDNAWGCPTTLTMTTDEAEEYNSMAGDITTYAQENFLRYIIGDLPVAELQNFVDTCIGMGLEDCLDIQQNALDRYYQR